MDGKDSLSLEFLAVVEGGIGPNVWDREVTVWADNIRAALDTVESQISDSSAAVTSIEQV